MMRTVRRSAAVAGLAGIVLAFAPAQASTQRGNGPVCAAPVAVAGGARLGCRPARLARRPSRTTRRLVADAQIPMGDAAFYGPGRYVSLLILGVGF